MIYCYVYSKDTEVFPNSESKIHCYFEMQSMCFCSCCWRLQTLKRETRIWVTLLLRDDLNVEQMPKAFGLCISGYGLSTFIRKLRNSHFSSAWFEASLTIFKIVFFVLHFVYLYSSLSVLDYSCRAASKGFQEFFRRNYITACQKLAFGKSWWEVVKKLSYS